MKEEIKKRIYGLSKEQLRYIIEEIIRIKPEVMDRGIRNLILYGTDNFIPHITGGIDHQYRTDNQYEGWID